MPSMITKPFHTCRCCGRQLQTTGGYRWTCECGAVWAACPVCLGTVFTVFKCKTCGGTGLIEVRDV